MIKLILPFIPPTSNHTQKHALRGKRIMRYNTPTYNAFKSMVENALHEKRNLEAFTAFLLSPHKVTISVHSPRVLTKKGEISKTFGDVDNFIKPLLDAVYKYLEANDALIVKVTASKQFSQYSKGDFTIIEWETTT